jgi:hypothetical protein
MLKTYVRKKNQIVQNSKFHTPTWLVFLKKKNREMTYVTKWIIDKNEVQQPQFEYFRFSLTINVNVFSLEKYLCVGILAIQNASFKKCNAQLLSNLARLMKN